MSLVVDLRNGWRSDGAVALQLAVRPLTGGDEMQLEEQSSLTPAAWANRLLAACTLDLASGSPVGLPVVRTLSLGDRERLLLAAYAANFAGTADMVLNCGKNGCGETIELQLDLATFLAERPGRGDGAQTFTIAEGETQVTCHLPTAGDLEAVAELGRTNPAAAADALVARCLVAASEPTGPRDPPLLDRLAKEVERRDPDAEIRIAVTCPSCGTAVQALLDAGAILRARCAMGEGIHAEVARLARVYHWSEAEILALPRQRRRRYLDLAASQEAVR
jgi:hypothetical protein